jgi:hypothetical protein
LPDYIPERRDMITAVAECERIEAKAGERGRAAQDANEHKGTHDWRQMKASASNSAGQRADHDAADDVDYQRSVWDGALQPVRKFQIYPVTRD